MPLMRLTGMNPYTAEDEERIRVLAATILAEERLGHISAKLAGALRKPLIRFQLPLVVIVGLDVSQDQRHLCPCDLTWKENDEEACRRDECEENGFHKLWQTN